MAKNNAEQDILVILAGGTIDSEVDEVYEKGQSPDRVIMTEDSFLPKHMHELSGGYRCEFKEWIRKDSNDFLRNEIQELIHIILNSPQDNIVITFGTDTMSEWSRVLEQELAGSGKKVVFVGSMFPLLQPGTDALNNLQYLLQNIDEFATGVHVVGTTETEKGVFGPGVLSPEEVAKLKTGDPNTSKFYPSVDPQPKWPKNWIQEPENKGSVNLKPQEKKR